VFVAVAVSSSAVTYSCHPFTC